MVEDMYTAQGGKCACCDKPHKMLVPDIRPNTTEVKGLICSKCDALLKVFDYDPEKMERTVNYIEQHRAECAACAGDAKQ